MPLYLGLFDAQLFKFNYWGFTFVLISVSAPLLNHILAFIYVFVIITFTSCDAFD